MIQEIIINTGKRITQRDFNTFINDKYRVQTTSLVEKKLTLNEIYAFIGVLILLGITKKSCVPIKEIWSNSSIHYASFAAAALSRKRFKLISKNITFDDLGN
jgi:membrane-associated HD superfamily phosphohydrolase